MGAHGGSPARERALLEATRRGDGGAFGRLVEPYRAELHAHCYRMLGSVQDAEDAFQDAMLGAWRGLAGFEGEARSGPGCTGSPPTPACACSRAAPDACWRPTTPPQRARKAVDERVPRPAQRAELAALGTDGRRELVDAFVDAWERADVPAILKLLAEDARFTIPPLPAWFLGRDDVGRFCAERMFATPWRLLPIGANGQLAFACYQGDPDGDRFRLGAVNVLRVRAGRIVELAGFLDPAVHRHFGLPAELTDDSRVGGDSTYP